ncbi:diguanylate cyclase [Telmatospirillum sp.]|uniref:sensor domain-containing diguanylate cyclase n=1 Tax=Telmatospirillum sp. TaxID=2079197 RepID=UPI0028416060|nr:diguanylate cyclase [Telmatospirillum sp.]MDR3436063.1 diguanylate cyclase [Telmatospirillum sp.]
MRLAISRLTSIVRRNTFFGLLRRIDRPGEYRAARIVAWATGLSVAVIWTIAVAALLEARKVSIANEKEVIERMAAVVEEQTRNELAKIQLFLNLVRSRYQQHFGLNPRRDSELEQYAEELRRSSNHQIDVSLVSDTGESYQINTPDAPALASVSDRDYFIAQRDQTTRGFFIGMPHIDPISGIWTLTMSTPLPGTPGGISLVAATINLHALEALYEAGRPKPNGSIALLSWDGNLLARAPADSRLIGKPLNVGEVWNKYLPAAQRGVVHITDSLVGPSDKLLAYVGLADFPLVVIVTTPVDDVLNQWRGFLSAVIRIGSLLTAMILFLAHHLIFRISELSQTRNELEKMALTDSLTGLSNRRNFWNHGQILIARLSRHPSVLSVLSLDLDHFKSINDRFGHAAGDEALRYFSRVLHTSLRLSDTAARLGGEEFSVLLPDTTIANAQILAERIRRNVSQTPVRVGDVTFFISVSIGVTGTVDTEISLERLLARADRALYQAKESGRNRCVAIEESTPEPEPESHHAI